MKRILVILSLVLSSQLIYAQGVRLGLKVHPLVSYYKSDTKDHESNGSKIGFSYGLMASFNFTDNYSFGTEFAVTTMPGSITKTDIDTTYDISYKLQYIELPLTIKLRTDEMGKMVFYGQFGLGTAYNIKASTKTAKSVTGNSKTMDSSDPDIGKDVNFLRASLIIGGGVEYSLGGKTALLAGLTFNNGFSDIMTSEKVKYTNSYFALNLGILF